MNDKIKILLGNIVGIIIVIVLIIFGVTNLTGCNRQIIDLNYSFTKAIIEGVGEIDIKSWTDYENSDMIQITGTDGTVYLTHSSNVILKSK